MCVNPLAFPRQSFGSVVYLSCLYRWFFFGSFARFCRRVNWIGLDVNEWKLGDVTMAWHLFFSASRVYQAWIQCKQTLLHVRHMTGYVNPFHSWCVLWFSVTTTRPRLWRLWFYLFSKYTLIYRYTIGVQNEHTHTRTNKRAHAGKRHIWILLFQSILWQFNLMFQPFYVRMIMSWTR